MEGTGTFLRGTDGKDRTMKEITREMKLASPLMASSGNVMRNEALALMKEELLGRAEEIFAANEEDLRLAAESGIQPQVAKRVRFDRKKLEDVCAGIDQLIALPDPVGRRSLHRELDEGLVLERISCPIGVIGVIFEARPDALVQISSLCVKSGNCAILKGGSESARTNRVLFEALRAGAERAGLPEVCLVQAEERSQIQDLLACDESVDLLIPRGSNSFVRYIMDHTRIPVMGHADGICHIFVDEPCDREMALRVILDAKTQYPVACNAVETVLVHRKAAASFLPLLKEALAKAHVTARADSEAAAVLDCDVISGDEFHKEYGDLVLAVRVVEDVKEAADHINRYGSHHTDAILTDNDENAAWFFRMVDSAGVYRNCSTRFADGFRYGFGAEVGISTGKLHARGPVGLDGLVTYKYLLTGSGQRVGEYASGEKQFHFRELL